MTGSTTLRWDIEFLSGSDINRVTFFLDGREFSPGAVYKFNHMSRSPLTSTMTTYTPTDLSGAIVLHSDGVQHASSDSYHAGLVS